jgi:hypothetical protein
MVVAQATGSFAQATRSLTQAIWPQGNPLYPRIQNNSFVYLYEVFIHARLAAADGVFSRQGF